MRLNLTDFFTSAVSSLATAAPWTAVPFHGDGVAMITGDALGAQWAEYGTRFAPATVGRRFKIFRGSPLYLRQNGSVAGNIFVEFYACSRAEQNEALEELARMAPTPPPSSTVNPKTVPSTSHSIGKIASVVAGAQITDGSFLLAAGAAQQLIVEITGDGLNTKGVFISDVSQADAAAFTCPPVYGAGLDEWVVPPGGKLWQAAADTLQSIYVKVVRS